MISRRNPNQMNDDNPMAKQMQTMTRVLPLMYLVFGFTLPAGLNVYFLVSSVFRIGQQALIYKMDPSLLPTATDVPSRAVEPKEKEKRPAADEVKERKPKPGPTAELGSGASGASQRGVGGPSKAAKQAKTTAGSSNGAAGNGKAPHPGRGGNRSKKKKRR
ncbi:MAG: YidC/Oxa1 family membrane protein insertase [Actinobacteria bacterium]|nr:YidC/Oxa1 family membrane protein insertase [Actinomycetota bacterium]